MFLSVLELNGMRVQAAMDLIRTLVQPKARQLGAATNTEEAYLCTRTKTLFLASKNTSRSDQTINNSAFILVKKEHVCSSFSLQGRDDLIRDAGGDGPDAHAGPTQGARAGRGHQHRLRLIRHAYHTSTK